MNNINIQRNIIQKIIFIIEIFILISIFTASLVMFIVIISPEGIFSFHTIPALIIYIILSTCLFFVFYQFLKND